MHTREVEASDWKRTDSSTTRGRERERHSTRPLKLFSFTRIPKPLDEYISHASPPTSSTCTYLYQRYTPPMSSVPAALNSAVGDNPGPETLQRRSYRY